MKSSASLWLLIALAVGCSPTDEEIVRIADPHVQVIDLQGQKKTIPRAELYEAGTGRPLVDSVLVVDRTSHRQLFVKIEELAPNSAGHSKYVLVTQDPSDVQPTPENADVR